LRDFFLKSSGTVFHHSSNVLTIKPKLLAELISVLG
jgi:hypothetical protein